MSILFHLFRAINCLQNNLNTTVLRLYLITVALLLTIYYILCDLCKDAVLLCSEVDRLFPEGVDILVNNAGKISQICITF